MRTTRNVTGYNGKNIRVKMLTAGQWMATNRGRFPAVVERTMGGGWLCRAVGGKYRVGKTMGQAVAAFYAGN
jgi:hypothetical protein